MGRDGSLSHPRATMRVSSCAVSLAYEKAVVLGFVNAVSAHRHSGLTEMPTWRVARHRFGRCCGLVGTTFAHDAGGE